MSRMAIFIVSLPLLTMCQVAPVVNVAKEEAPVLKPLSTSTLVPPTKEAAVFLDGLVSTLDAPEMNGALTQDGNEFYYCAQYQGNWSIFRTRNEGNDWTEPVPLSFTAGYTDRDFTMSSDGKSIYFGSNRPRLKGGPAQEYLDIFVTRKLQDGQWMEPEAVGSPINTDHGENYPSIASNGNLYYFSCRKEGFGGCDLYMSEFVEGQYVAPVLLPETINSDKNDWDAFVAPDESYLIFSSQDRADSLGAQDLYISFRDETGQWTQAVNMGASVNSADDEICPSVSQDGKHLFFTSRRRGNADVFWISTDVIREHSSN